MFWHFIGVEILAASMLAITMIWMSKFDIMPAVKLLVYIACSIAIYETVAQEGFGLVSLEQTAALHVAAITSLLIGLMALDISVSPWLDTEFPKAYGPTAFRMAKVKIGPQTRTKSNKTFHIQAALLKV